MKKINLAGVPEEERTSPKGKFSRFARRISEALGSEPAGVDQGKKHPFDLMYTRVPPGTSFCPYHSHSAQWEMYVILTGSGNVRDESGTHEVGPGDAFVYRPGEAHQVSCAGSVDLVYYVIADNPPGDSTTYPDSKKWAVWDGTKRILIQGTETSYWTGEE